MMNILPHLILRQRRSGETMRNTTSCRRLAGV
jgi:hypothetical protein